MNELETELYRLMDKDGKTPEEAALAAIKWHKRKRLPSSLFLPFVFRVAQTHQRNKDRAKEDAAFGSNQSRRAGIHPSSHETPDPAEPTADRSPQFRAFKEVSSVTFKVGRGLMEVEWGKATAEQHEIRAQWQRARGISCIADADRHTHAAELIYTTPGAECLKDIPLEKWQHLVDDDAGAAA